MLSRVSAVPPSCVLATHEYAPFRGGVATYVREMHRAAREEGLTVEVWTVDYRGRRGCGDGVMTR